MTEEEARAEVLKSIEDTGCRERVSEEVIGLLSELARYSRFFFDSVMISRATSNILDFVGKRFAQEHPEINLNDQQKARGRLAALLHDVGKCGPGQASGEAREAVLALFRIETRKHSPEGRKFKDLPVSEVVSERYPQQKEKLLRLLADCGVSPDGPMHAFWNKHAYWTKEILEANPGGLGIETRIIAASHHIDKGHDPYGISSTVDASVRFQARAIGVLEEYTLASPPVGYVEELERRVLLASDKYQAAVRRNDFGHEEAFQSLKSELGDAYDKDELMGMVLTAIDELGKNGEIFK